MKHAQHHRPPHRPAVNCRSADKSLQLTNRPSHVLQRTLQHIATLQEIIAADQQI